MSSKKEHKDRVTQILKSTKETLTDTLQEELCNPTESGGEESINKITEDTIKQLIRFLKEDRLVTTKF